MLYVAIALIAFALGALLGHGLGVKASEEYHVILADIESHLHFLHKAAVVAAKVPTPAPAVHPSPSGPSSASSSHK